MTEFERLVSAHLAGICRLEPLQTERLLRHYELLLKWNPKLNLTRVIGLEEAAVRHYCESLFLGAHLPREPLRVVDIGSGAGFPGIPIAVLRKDCQVTLVESHQRKAVFLREATRDCPNVIVRAQRAETLDDTFDWAVSRAVSGRDLAGLVPKLAPNLAVLSGESTEPEAFQGVNWDPPVRLPWGDRTLLCTGHAP